MKKIALIAFLLAALCSASAYVVCVAAPLLNRTVQGSGRIVTKNLPAPDFNAIDASRAVRVVLSAEASEIGIEADDNLIDLVVVETRGKTLEVTLDNKASDIRNSHVTVTVPARGENIRSLRASSASKIRSDAPLRADKFAIRTSSAAKIQVAVEASSCSIEASSASKVAAEVQATACTIEVSSAAKIALAGSVEDLTADLSSAAKLDAAQLDVLDATIDASSAARAEIDCRGKLTASASSGSSIRYTGDCRTSLHESSGASIRKK